MNRDGLLRKSTEYLGLWFDLIDPRFAGGAGHEMFANSSAETMRRHAETLAAQLGARKARSGADRFIISNEYIFGLTESGSISLADSFAPFINEIRKHVQVRLIVYVRDPYDWLPSAYNQWGVYHKTAAGPIRPYPVLGRALIGSYAGLLRWHQHHPDILEVRHFAKSRDVVEDFSSVLGIALDRPKKRDFERVSISESIIRYVYNSRYDRSVLPDQFDTAIAELPLSAAPRINEVISDNFSYEETSKIVEENKEMFSSIQHQLGLKLLSDTSMPAPMDEDALRKRIVEQLLYIVVEQADRITALEKAVSKQPYERLRRFLRRCRAALDSAMGRDMDPPPDGGRVGDP